MYTNQYIKCYNYICHSVIISNEIGSGCDKAVHLGHIIDCNIVDSDIIDSINKFIINFNSIMNSFKSFLSMSNANYLKELTCASMDVSFGTFLDFIQREELVQGDCLIDIVQHILSFTFHL